MIPARAKVFIWAVTSMIPTALLSADEFRCPVGKEVTASLGQGVSLRTCMWEREPSVFIRTGPLELIKNGILILKTQTDRSGKLHGRFTSWDDRGEIIENGNYVRGLKEGPWLKIDEQGNRQILHFNGGNLVDP